MLNESQGARDIGPNARRMLLDPIQTRHLDALMSNRSGYGLVFSCVHDDAVLNNPVRMMAFRVQKKTGFTKKGSVDAGLAHTHIHIKNYQKSNFIKLNNLNIISFVLYCLKF